MLTLGNGIMNNFSFFLFVVKTMSTLLFYSFYYSGTSLSVLLINWDSNQRFGPEGRNKHSTETEWRNGIQKNERLRNLQDILKCSNTRIIGVPEGEKEEQKIENLFEQILENFPNLAKEIVFQEVQEAQSLKEVGPKESHTKAHHNYITQD